MDLKLMLSFLLYGMIATVTAFFLWFRLSRRSRGNTGRSINSQEGEAESSTRSPSSSPPSVREDGFQYDVFLSFRGSDTRKSFTDLLYEALQNEGISTFIDTEKLLNGQKVEVLFGHIERSKIFVPIFSEGYADSRWCLMEIAKIVDCKRLIIPVFFDVKPRDVHHQTGPFAPAFQRHLKNKKIDKEEASKWSDALREAATIAGYTLTTTNGDLVELVQCVVKRILTEVKKTPLFAANHAVGLDSRIADLMELLDVEAQDDARIVGIHGMGGIGKTTLAKAVYNQIFSHFDACSFIVNIREAAKQPSGLISLQKQLLRDLFKVEHVDISSTSDGMHKIKERIQSKKVLLVLDDLDHESQLDALVGSLDWFCSGSRIIITTKNKQILEAPKVKINHVYEPGGLDASQSLRLFCWHAFGTEEPAEEFAELSREVASVSAGLPLALTTFGSHFVHLKTTEEWRVVLERLKEGQDKDVKSHHPLFKIL